MLDRFAIAARLREIGELLRFQGESSFRARAYDQGADALDGLSEPVERLIAERRLVEVPGIGKGLAAQITELAQRGTSRMLERLRVEAPPGVIELSRVRGLSSKKILTFVGELGIRSVADLKAACESGRVRGLAGFGAKTEQKILQAIREHESRGDRILLLDALELGERLLSYLRACPQVARAELAGEVRRFCETVDKIVIVVGTDDPERALDHMARYPEVARLLERDESQMTGRLGSGTLVEVHTASAHDFFRALFWWTGATAHIQKVRHLAARKKVHLEPGACPMRGHGPPKASSEADLYKQIGLPWIPPELREDGGEIEQAQTGSTWTDLIGQGEIRGMTHCHTVYSDGRNTIEEMARAAEAIGMSYLTITDHSPSASYAGGVTLDRLERQWEEIERVQEKVSVRLLRGTESDILADGALDYPDAILEKLDIIIASIHVRHGMDEAQMTQRIVRAMRHPLFKIWGHALGRLLLRREPIACRVEEVLDAIAQSRAAIEVNGDPYRLDMAPRWLREARARKIRFIISTDAHSTRGFGNLHFGIGIARRGGLRRQDVLNAMSAEDFCRAVRPAG